MRPFLLPLCGVAVVLVPAIACRGDADAATPASALVVGFIAGDTTADGALLGARLGAEEASRTGSLLGRAFVLREAHASGVAQAVTAGARLLDDGAVALVGGHDEGVCRALDSLARARGALYVNTGCRGDALRAPAGSPAATALHIEASDSMYLAALSAARATGGAAPVLWHGGLSRYGATQLNQRFARRFGRSADGAAWANWMAMKVLWQGALDAPRLDAATLAARLTAADAEFDGHKGEPLRFDRTTGQLVQPLFPPSAGTEGAQGSESAAAFGVAPDAERRTLRAAFEAGTPMLVVSNEGSSDVQVVDATRGTVLATVPFAERPRGVQTIGDGRHAWVALSDERPTEAGGGDGIAVLDLRDGRTVARHPAGSDPEQFATNRAGTLMIAANEDAGTATLVETRASGAPGRAVATLVVGIEPEGVAMSPDGRWAYITAETSNTVSVVDTRAMTVVASFLVDERPRAVAFAPDGRTAIVTNEISGTATVIDVARHAPIATLSLAGGAARPVGIVFSADGRTAYIANGRANSVSVVDIGDRARPRERQVIAVGRRPWGLALSRDGTRLYTANGGSNDLSVVDTRTGTVTATFPVGERPWGVAVAR